MSKFLARILKEVDEVLGHRETVEYEDLGQLQYLDQTLKEAYVSILPFLPLIEFSKRKRFLVVSKYQLKQ